ncbi:MAG: PQQ-dependent sugar dehydrogenase [Akkermansiaceae bacterium]|nr:PQQ-dependent sugar dehydrogenase [Akkermansiaceae bacterium]
MKPNFSLCISVLCILAIPSNAATIDWITADISNVSDVATVGTLVTAQNYAGTGASSTVTVAGVNFSENNSLATDAKNTNGDFFAFDTGDSNYNEFLGDLDFTDDSSVTIPMSVVIGTRYVVQVWYAEDGGFGLNPQRTNTLTGTGDNVLNGNDYAVGIFVADATTQDLIITSSREGVRLTGYQLRSIPSGAVTIADAAADYSGPTSLPPRWQYLLASSPTATPTALATNQAVGTEGHNGFGGGGLADSASILGSRTGANPFRLYSNAGHNGVEGVDLLFQPGDLGSEDNIIARYTVSAADVALGTTATLSGSFRDLQGNTSGDAGGSVRVYVYHNSSKLFDVTGANGRLTQANGTFNLTDITVAAGDTISFIVGSNGNYGGDETAVKASISVEPSFIPVAAKDDSFDVLIGSTTILDVLANDEGLDGDADLTTLRITSLPTSGNAVIQNDDTIQYEHTGSMGSDSFGYAFDNLAGNITYSATVTILASNGLKMANSTLTFSDQAPTGGYQFTDAFSGLTFAQPTCLETIPGNSQAVVVTERAGRIQIIPDVTAASPVKTLFLDISGDTKTSTFCGLRGVAFHPDFATNRYFYVGYDHNNGNNDTVRVSRFTANASNLNQVNASTELVLLENGSDQSIHRINRLQFGPDGYLYIAVGDDGNFDGPPHTQRIDDGFWSSVLRIDVDKNAGNYEPANTDGVNLDGSGNAYYSVPSDNPFIDSNFTDGRGVTTLNGQTTPTNDPYEVRTEMYAIGFRNPWKIGFVPGTGELWVADDGHASYEKFCIMPKGGNAGWGYFEGTDPGVLQKGTTQYPGPLSDPPAGVDFVQPVMEYNKPGSTATGGVKSIIGGTFYQGTEIAELTGAFVFADYTSGDIWYMKRPNNAAFQYAQRVAVGSDWGMAETGMVTQMITDDFEAKSYGVSEIVKIGTEGGITAMQLDPSDGSVLMLDYDNSIIRRLIYNPDDGSLPATLTATGAFSNLTTLTPNVGVNPYDLNLRFWSDHADKTRYFALKELSDTISYSEDGLWGFPSGSVWIKHFDMDLNRDSPGTNVKRLETRFLVKTEDDFYGVSYRWNAAGTEADLVANDGEEFDLTITEGGSTHTQTWKIPSRGDCRTCHTNDNGVMLGFNTRQLNRQGSLSGTSDNFLKLLNEAGYLSSTEALPSDYANLPKFYRPEETSENIEERVRSYLAVNCSYCHYDGSNAVPNSWSGDPFLTMEQTNLLHTEGVGFVVADPTDRLIIPGNTSKSMLLSLVSESNGYSRMPPLATDLIDVEGVTLITDWINNYANAKPTFDADTDPFTILENQVIGTVAGTAPAATDQDSPDVTRGTLTYSIIDGNSDGFFDIDSITGQIFINQFGPDYELATFHDLTVMVSDGFTANPGEASATVRVDVTDIVNDDSQRDGITDEWAKANFGLSAIDPSGDFDQDGFNELLEFWADSDPSDTLSKGLTITPSGVVSDPGEEGYLFEWTIRSELVIGTDYIVQGSDDLNFTNLTAGVDFTVMPTTPVENPGGADLILVKVKVPTTASRYFLRLHNP